MTVRGTAYDGIARGSRRPSDYRDVGRRAPLVTALAEVRRARKIVERIDHALFGLDSRGSALLEQLARERALRQPERVRERSVRTREHACDMGLGR